MRTITALPADLATLSGADLKRAIDERRGRLAELLDAGEGSYTAAGVQEAKQLNDELERLEEKANTVQPHPGHYVPGGGASRRPRQPGDFGRLEGLGAEFLHSIGRGAGGTRAALDGTGGGATMPSSFFDPRLRELPQRQLFVRSLIPTTRVNTDKVAYIRQSVFTNNAAAVAAGGTKPTSVITAERLEAPIKVIAHVSEAVDRSLLSDYDQLASFVDNQLRLGVLLAEENQILNGSGTGANLTGILNTAGIQTQAKGADPTPDAVQKAITKVRLQFAEPDAVVFHPNDWQEVSLLRTADGIYIWGSPADEGPLRMWGLTVVTSPVIAEGTALVGAFGVGAEVYEREGARVTFTESGLADGAGTELFLKNQLRFRGESRLGLAVIRPAFFCSVTGI